MMGKDLFMKTDVVTIKESVISESNLFEDDNCAKYTIPLYQRKYSWGIDQLQKFLSSILNGYNNDKSPVFMGTIQFSQCKNSDSREIIDGQQRLTTIILLIKVLELKYQKEYRNNKMTINFPDNEEIEKQYDDVISLEQLKKEDINSNKFQEYYKDEINIYKKNIAYINGFMSEKDSTDIVNENNIDDFIKYLFEQVYFVELVTVDMPLPKIVSIFNAINTTGLDLNTSDIFKLQYYDYLNRLHKDNNNGHSWIKAINDCYKEIDDFKTKTKEKENKLEAATAYDISMQNVITIYKHIICAKHKLKWEELSKSNDTFFEDLFSSKEINEYEDILKFDNFKKVVDVYKKVFETIYFTNKINKKDIYLFLVGDITYLTRYSKFFTIPYIYEYFKEENAENINKDSIKEALDFALCCAKYFAVFSVNYDKVIGHVHTFITNDILPEIANKKQVEELKKIIENDRDNIEYYGNKSQQEEFFDRTEKGLFYNAKRARIICTLSALIDEAESASNNCSLYEIIGKLFHHDNPTDIEHIYARDLFKDDNTIDKDRMNGIGNLVLLESSINRSIGNENVLQKCIKQNDKPCYKQSKLESIKKLVKIIEQPNFVEWKTNEAQDRIKSETKKLKKFIFNEV